MAQQHSNPPNGPRRGARGTPNFRGSPRGGIQKRSNANLRFDKDGDLNMEPTVGNGRGRGRGSGGRGFPPTQPTGGRNVLPSRQPRNNLIPAVIEKAIFGGSGSVSTVINNPSAKYTKAGALGEPVRGKSGLDQIAVSGWKQSKASSNPDGGVRDLLDFLERKASHNAPPHERVKIKKSRIEGDALVVSVRPEDTEKVMRLDSFQFAGVPLAIQMWLARPEPISEDGVQLLDKITAMIERRYNKDLKFLDLSALGNEAEFAVGGMFDTTARQTKFFLALMKVCDTHFATPEQKRETVVSVSLANNALPNVTPVTILSQTFPDVKNLDLSNNNLTDLQALQAWRWKFRSLEHLILAGNPIEAEVPSYQEEMTKWYPKLHTLNSTRVRSEEEIAAPSKSVIPIPILSPSFRDEASVGHNFVTEFFSTYDRDRNSLVKGYYDSESTFSLSVNVSAPRSQDSQTKAQNWEQYIKKSRNLTKITTLPARMARIYKGIEKIRDSWLTLPTTTHPNIVAEPEKWNIECHSIPGLPDPTGQSPSGVGGLMVMVHGEFKEFDVSTGNTTNHRSFDRTFVLGPGGGIGGVRVLNDVLVLRAYGGHDAWKPTDEDNNVSSVPSIPLKSLLPILRVPEGFGAAGPGKTAEQVQQEHMALELSKATGMTLQYSGMCLEQNAWNLDVAGNAFQQAKANLPAEAFF